MDSMYHKCIVFIESYWVLAQAERLEILVFSEFRLSSVAQDGRKKYDVKCALRVG